MSKSSINENEFFGAPGGTNGTVNYQTGYGTHTSPEVSQNSGQFANSNNNKALGSNSNTIKDVPDSGSMEKDLGAIYAKKDTPTPDEIIMGIKYELGQQNKKDKQKAKETVLANLRKDPHYYGAMKMLGVDDESMVKNMQETKSDAADKINALHKAGHGKWIGSCGHVIKQCRCPHGKEMEFHTLSPCDACMQKSSPLQESKQHPNDRPAQLKLTPNVDETKKIFAEMAKAKDKKYVVNSHLVNVMDQMWKEKQQRRSWLG